MISFLGVKLCAEKKLEKPRTINLVEMVPNKVRIFNDTV